MIFIFLNGKFIFRIIYLKISFFSESPEEIRGTADVFYLQPLTGQNPENSIWFSHEPLSARIIDQILNRLKLLPDFYHQTKPVETTVTSSNNS
jgi:hypothetical protein